MIDTQAKADDLVERLSKEACLDSGNSMRARKAAREAGNEITSLRAQLAAAEAWRTTAESWYEKYYAAEAQLASARKALVGLLEMPSACVRDEEVLENNIRREIARRPLNPDGGQ